MEKRFYDQPLDLESSRKNIHFCINADIKKYPAQEE